MPSTNGNRISRTNQSAIASTTSTPTQKRAGRVVMDSYAHGLSSPSTFCIGALEMRMIPDNGVSSSSTRKTAPTTDSTATINATVVVALRGATRLKLAKITTSQQSTVISIGIDTEGMD